MAALDMKGSIHAGAECTRLEQELDKILAANETRVIFDMAGVTHIDSAATPEATAPISLDLAIETRRVYNY